MPSSSLDDLIGNPEQEQAYIQAEEECQNDETHIRTMLQPRPKLELFEDYSTDGTGTWMTSPWVTKNWNKLFRKARRRRNFSK